MAIQNITTDYTGRKKDISIMRNTVPTVANAQPVTLEFGKVSAYCAGVQKLVQRYTVIFFTAVGSQPDYPDFGTPFYTTVVQSNIGAKSEILHKFNFANLKTIETIRAYQQASTVAIPLDEQINTATLLDLVISTPDSLQLKIKIKTNAGESVDFLMPLPL